MTSVQSVTNSRIDRIMRLPILATLVLFTIIHCAESRQTWFPQRLIDSFSDKTAEITNYVRSKGRKIREYYIENVRNKVTSYFKGENESDSYAQKNTRRKSSNEGQALSKISQAKVPDAIEQKCSGADPATRMTTPQLIALNGYPAESHTIVTDDGYILTVHRIPYSRNSTQKMAPRRTVLLHHGLLGSSADWIITGPEKGLGYILADAGYDVWLANARGNTYSRAHTHRLVNSAEFWNFTFHEISQHDLPAVIDYIMEVKGWDVKINYIGHSMGTTVLFALLSTKRSYNKVLRAGFALAPVAYMTDIQSPLRLLAKFSSNIEYLMNLLGVNEFLPQSFVLRWLSKHACEINHYEEAICENSLFVLCGHDAKQFNATLLPIILGHVPAGASTKTLIHYAQEIKNDGRFQQFDYGPAGNIKEYDSVEPPEYPLHKITLPIALLSSENDWLSSDFDVTNLFVQLGNPIEHYIVPLKEFNHIDFLWAIDAPTLVYNKLLKLLDDSPTPNHYNPNVISTSSDLF